MNTQTTQFDLTKPVQRRDRKGRVEILCADLTGGPYQIAAKHVMDEGVCVLTHTIEGHLMSLGESDSDLINIPEPPKWRVWTPEEAIGQKVKRKTGALAIIVAVNSTACIVNAQTLTYLGLMDEYTTLDGQPCGVQTA